MHKEYETAPQKREADELVRQFLRELDACATERERMDKVMELVFGVTRAARKGVAHGSNYNEQSSIELSR